MAKERRPAVDYAVYLAVRLVVTVVQALPTDWAFGFASILAQVAYRVDRRHRKVAAENLAHAFPAIANNPAAIDRLVWGCYRHLAMLLIEIILLPRKLKVDHWRSYASLIHGERVLDGLVSKRATLIVTAHFGNWELAGYALGALGFRTYAIARVLDNPHLERFLKQFRQATGQQIIAKKDRLE